MKKFIIIFFISISTFSFSQKKQPKVGLVLSGGGAKGFAHIGVLKEIEKAGVQLDYIGGTSMGAIVGGLYAAGFSADQIENIIIETDFVDVLTDKMPRGSSPFFEKEYLEKTVVTLPVNKGKIGFPKAVSKGQSILNLLLELLDETEGLEDFSKLSVPFFCVATDVENGNQILIEKGSLPLALRASGSFPTLLDPVLIDGKLLVDGGIANNLPVSVMKSKGVDIIIGVDVEGKLTQKENLTSAIAILNQIVSYQMYSKTKEEKEKLDIYIHPDIFDYGVVDFDKKEEILLLGEKAAKKFSEEFKEIAAQQVYKKKRSPIKINHQKRYISKINISGNKYYTKAYVLGKLNIKVGDTVSREDISQRIYSLTATKNYSRVEYQLKKDADNEDYELSFNLKESKENATISLGAHYDYLYKSSLLVNYSQKHLFEENDVFSLDFVLGDNLRYNLNYFVDNGFYLSYGFRSRFNHFTSNSKFNALVFEYPNISSINLKYTDVTNQFFVQTTFDRRFALGLGIEQKYLNIDTETIASENSEETIFDNSNYFNGFGYVKLDTYDKKYFVTKGYYADFNFKWYMSSSDYNNDFTSFAQAKGTFGFATTLANRLAFQMTNEAGFQLNNTESDVFDFYLGDYNQNFINTFVSFYGYDLGELSDDSFIKSEFNLRLEFVENHYLSFIANYARLDSNVFKDIDLFKDVKSGYAVGYSLNSLIGPLEIKYSWSPDTKQEYWLFNLGFWF